MTGEERGTTPIVTDELAQKVHQIIGEILFHNFIILINVLKFWGVVCFELSQRDCVTNEELVDEVKNWLDTVVALFFDEVLEKLVPQYDKCMNLDGDKYEKVMQLYMCVLLLINFFLLLTSFLTNQLKVDFGIALI